MIDLKENKTLILIDGNSIIHRAFHALPLLTTKKGELVNAIYGFLLVFLRMIRELKPNYLAATFDLKGPTFRHYEFKDYKATRAKTPEGICEQLPKVKEILKNLRIPIYEKEGFEADDVIATICHLALKEAKDKNLQIVILSGDSDTLQLIDEKTKVCYLKKGVKDILLYDKDVISEKYQGLTPDQLIDFKALKGDPSDNIPGVKGIGEKTAIDLLKKFKNLENLYEAIEKNKNLIDVSDKIKESLIKYKENAFLSKKLIQLQKNSPIDFNLEDCRWQQLNKEKAKEMFERFEFQSLIKRLNDL